MKEELKKEFEESIKAKRARKAEPLCLGQILSMRLSAFAEHDIAIKIYSEIL